MDPYQQVKEKLDELGISFDVGNTHPHSRLSRRILILKALEGVRTKSMFLTNKKKTLVPSAHHG